MSRLLSKFTPVLKRATAVSRPMMTQQTRRSMTTTASAEYTEAEFKHAQQMFLGLGGSLACISYAMWVLSGEPEHERAHPYYMAPYDYVRREKNPEAKWWPGRHCQLFEFNCFAQVYEEADRLLKQVEKEKLEE